MTKLQIKYQLGLLLLCSCVTAILGHMVFRCVDRIWP